MINSALKTIADCYGLKVKLNGWKLKKRKMFRKAGYCSYRRKTIVIASSYWNSPKDFVKIVAHELLHNNLKFYSKRHQNCRKHHCRHFKSIAKAKNIELYRGHKWA